MSAALSVWRLLALAVVILRKDEQFRGKGATLIVDAGAARGSGASGQVGLVMRSWPAR